MASDMAATERPTTRQQPLLFKRLEPFEPARHTGLKYDRSNRNYHFAEGVSVVPLTMQEFVTAGVYYPIIFSEGPQPMPMPFWAIVRARICSSMPRAAGRPASMCRGMCAAIPSPSWTARNPIPLSLV